MKHKQPVPPMGPVLYIDDDDPHDIAMQKMKDLQPFLKKRREAFIRQKRIYEEQRWDVDKQQASIHVYCDKQREELEEAGEEDAPEYRKLFDLCQYFSENEVNFFQMDVEEVKDTYPDEYYGAFNVDTPYETRIYIHKAINEIKDVHQRLSKALLLSSPKAVVKKAQLDTYYFQNVFTPIFPFLSAVVKNRVFSAKDLYDKTKAVDLGMLKETYQMIQRYLVLYFQSGKMSEEEIPERIAQVGYGDPYEPPFGAKRLRKASSAPAKTSPKKSKSKSSAPSSKAKSKKSK